MAKTRTKKVKPIETPAVETPVETLVETPEVITEVAEESQAKKEFRAFMESYKSRNPVKYALKEQELLKQLNKL